MGVTPSNLSKLGDVNLIGLNTNLTSTSSTKNDVANTCIGLATSIGELLLSGMVSRKSADGAGDAIATPQPTAEQQAKAALNNIDIQLAEVNGQISYLEGECTSQEQIDAKEQNIKNLEAEVTTSDGKTITKEQVSKYIEANNKFNKAKTNLATATTNATNAQNKVNTLEAELKSIDSIDDNSGTTEEVEIARNTKQKEIEAAKRQLKAAKEEEAKAQQLFEEAERALDDAGTEVHEDGTTTKQDWQISIDAKLDKIETEKAELAEMKATMNSNKKSLETLYAKRSQLEQERAGAQAVYDKMITDNVVANGKKNQQINAAGEDYTAADQKDGNWWKRNMPSWLGGSKGLKKEEYKKQHQQKQAAEETLNNLGVDVDDYLKKQNISDAKKFAESPTLQNNFSADLIYSYLKKNPGVDENTVKAGLETKAEKIAKQVADGSLWVSSNAKQNAIKDALIKEGYSESYAQKLAKSL